MHHRKPILIATLLAFALLLWLGMVSAVINLSPAACGLCHAKELEKLRASPHAGSSCAACHEKNGALGFIIGQMDVVRMASLQLTGGFRKPVTAEVDGDACENCHSAIEKGVTERAGIRMEHGGLAKRNIACTECHNEVAHGNAVPVPKLATMDKCALCHAGSDGKPEKCTLCHSNRPGKQPTAKVGSWISHHGGGSERTHGMGNLNTCAACHKKEMCSRCHIEMPHPESWPSDHGAAAATRAASNQCLKCHRASYCDSCHGLKMPHQAGFLKVHSEEIKRLGSDRACYNCHLKEDCTRCHERHVHPGGVAPAKAIPKPE
ncbi:MAG: hypothetical protein M1335_06885 [Chloroflexi bacterium]|nr:hypothetical protein [Chloroflexota bacterium]